MRSTRGEDRFALFAGAWALFLVVHMSATYFRWFQFSDPVELALGAAAWATGALLLLGPSSLVRLVVSSLAFLAYKAYLLPSVPNHILLAVFIAITILAATAAGIRRWVAIGHEGGTPRLRRLIFQRLAPVVAIELMVMYFFVVLHKLNWDYLNPAVSCGFSLYEEIVEATGGVLPLAAWMGYPCLLGALLLEAAIPVCLFFRRTRMIGIGLGIAFHTMLALHPNLYIYSYSALLFACYTVFLPRGFVTRLRQRLSRLPRVEPWQVATGVGVLGIIAGLALAASTGFERGATIAALHDWAPPVVKTFFFVCAGAIAAMFVLGHCGTREARATYPAPSRLLHGSFGALAALPLLMVLNGFSPYLSLKTGTSFAMFSNLRTEGGVNNHLFMPRLAGPPYQDDLVAVVESDDPRLQKWAAMGLHTTSFELRRYLYEEASPDVRVVVLRGGQQHELALHQRRPVNVAPGIADLLTPPGWLERRLLIFRPVPPAGQPMPCSH